MLKNDPKFHEIGSKSAAPRSPLGLLHSHPPSPCCPLNGAAKRLFCGNNCDRRYGGQVASIFLAATLRGRKPIMHKRSLLHAVALGATVAVMSSTSLLAQVALSGKVSSAEEGAMEGVLVSAKKEGSTI